MPDKLTDYECGWLDGQREMRERAAAAVENPASELLQMAADDIRELPLTPAPTEEGDGTDDPQAERRP